MALAGYWLGDLAGAPGVRLGWAQGGVRGGARGGGKFFEARAVMSTPLNWRTLKFLAYRAKNFNIEIRI